VSRAWGQRVGPGLVGPLGDDPADPVGGAGGGQRDRPGSADRGGAEITTGEDHDGDNDCGDQFERASQPVAAGIRPAPRDTHRRISPGDRQARRPPRPRIEATQAAIATGFTPPARLVSPSIVGSSACPPKSPVCSPTDVTSRCDKRSIGPMPEATAARPLVWLRTRTRLWCATGSAVAGRHKWRFHPYRRSEPPLQPVLSQTFQAWRCAAAASRNAPGRPQSRREPDAAGAQPRAALVLAGGDLAA
jgi:hypothetical protein